ncbi:hypothetical protein PpBr36_01137 [Pyricularia pennisetigena]|uniref:hypothetical protein n=1 Tax=Pyricularia pennisetigena TaxID=1578925 RepID=UPI00114E331C|nr:hypothetical protein PpBr36_01137 [Pyricularia pennisetigena]TLS29587.1 hypothetical protein PpBr36_01137 [Pyricularia pennisetigena]
MSKNNKKRRRCQDHGSEVAGDFTCTMPAKKRNKGGRIDELELDKQSRPAEFTHPVLSQYFPCLKTLREHLLASLPSSSRIRRRKIAAIGGRVHGKDGAADKPLEAAVAQLLDSTIVAASEEQTALSDGRWEQWANFSQRGDESYVTLTDGVTKALFCQSEIVSFVIWSLFEREKKCGGWPRHLLCDGFSRGPASRANGYVGLAAADAVPGIFVTQPNPRVKTLKSSPWPELLSMLGQAGERIMIDLLLDHSIFVKVQTGNENYYQLSGRPITNLEPIIATKPPQDLSKVHGSQKSAAEIVFVRSRMLYSRAALNARGAVHFGLRHIHVLNRYPAISEDADDVRKGKGGNSKLGDAARQEKMRGNTIHCMMYMFPRQFGLHNAFTSVVDHTQTSQRFQDYTLREEEIQQKFKSSSPAHVSIPKRLRGTPFHLVEKMQILHRRCSYSALLKHYCPASSTNSIVASLKDVVKRDEQALVLELSTPAAHVSAYCQAVLSKLVPDKFWGEGQTRVANKKVFLKHVDHFIKLRRFETMNLHELSQGFKIKEIEWLAPPKLSCQKASQSDRLKRIEIFQEFLYYLFDSILIPLIRSNFYVTESSTHRSQLFFFRHDVWRQVAEPFMAVLKVNTYEEMSTEEAQRILGSRDLNFSQVRLLPKGSSMRPITNLRRRALANGSKKMLGASINTILGPAHTMLKYEKTKDPSRLGSAMFSVGDIYSRLKAFKERVGTANRRFYFAKVDVKAAFDTIPQSAVLQLISEIPTHGQYKLIKHAEVERSTGDPSDPGKLAKRWRSYARGVGDHVTFMDVLASQIARNKNNAVYFESVFQKVHNTIDLMNLITSHIKQNLIRIGKRFYRQKDGIPQGSILSSLLCNYFYADLELKKLAFLQSGDCLLLRLIDDFLLITLDVSKARQFIEVMHAGVPEYGVTVNPNKSLVNFDVVCQGVEVPKLGPGRSTGFPYCGTLISCSSLDVSKDRRDPAAPRALTVDFSRHQGLNFQRKVLNAFKIQSHLMFFDSTHNSRPTVLANLFGALAETAKKMWAYARAMPQRRRPRTHVVLQTITTLVDVAYALLASKSRRARFPGYECGISKKLVKWLSLHAFKRVLAKRQAGYGQVLSWLDTEIRKLNFKGKLPVCNV